MDLRELRASLERHYRNAHPDYENITIGKLERITGGFENFLASFELLYAVNGERTAENMLFKGYGDRAKAKKEIGIVQRLSRQRFPVPPIYEYSSSENTVFNCPFIVMARIEGKSLVDLIVELSARPDADIVRIVGLLQGFADLHLRLLRIDAKDYLDILEGDSALARPHFLDAVLQQHFLDAILREWQISFSPDWLRTMGPGFQVFEPLLEWLASEKKKITLLGESLLHGDFHPRNVLVRDDGSMVVIDWTFSQISDFRVGVGWTLFLVVLFFGPDARSIIMNRYQTALGDRMADIEFFEVLSGFKMLVQLLFCLKYPDRLLGQQSEIREILQYPVAIARAVQVPEEITNRDLSDISEEILAYT